MEASTHAQLRLLRHWQHPHQPARCPAARPSTPARQPACPAAAQQRPKWQPPGSDGIPQKQKAPRRTTYMDPKPSQMDFAQIFAACRAAARELLREGGLTHALAEWNKHPMLSLQGGFAYRALVKELRETFWRLEIPRDGIQAVMSAVQEQDLKLGPELLVAAFLSYNEDDSAVAFQLLERLQSGNSLKLRPKDITELCSACARLAEPAAIRRIIGLAASLGLRLEQYWYTSLIAAHAEAGDVEGAALAYEEKYAAGLPCELHTQCALAWAYARAGRFDEAKAYLETSSLHQELQGKDLQTVLTLFGTLGSLDRVESLLKDATEHSMKAENVCWWAAVAYAEAGRPADVERINQQAAAKGIRVQRVLNLIIEAYARAGDLRGMKAWAQQLPIEERWRHTACCQLVVDALGKAGAFEDSQEYVEQQARNDSKGLLHIVATHSHWLSAWGQADEAEAALLAAPMADENQWRNRPRLTADLCSSAFMASWSWHAARDPHPLEEEQQERFKVAEAFAAKGAAPQPRHRYFDLDLSTDLAWPAQLRLLAWLQGLLSTARSGSPILEYQTEVRFLAKQHSLRKEGILAPEDTRAALLGLLRNLGIPAAVSATDKRLVVVQVADLKLAIGDRLRRRGSFEAWPNRALLVKPVRA